MGKTTHQVISDQEFKASEFPAPEVWEAEKVVVQGCNIIVDAPLPSHAAYISCIFYGWPSFTPDPKPVRFSQNYVQVMEQWVAKDNIFNIAGSMAQTSLTTFILKGGKIPEGG